MVRKIRNNAVARHADVYPATPVDGYGNLSYTPYPWGTGHLPRALKNIFHNRSHPYRSPFIKGTIYSYGTPIAWFDSEYGVWVVPDVRYSVTTSKHQSTLWALRNYVSIPADCGMDEYLRYVSGKMIYARFLRTAPSTIPGPNYVDGE